MKEVMIFCDKCDYVVDHKDIQKSKVRFRLEGQFTDGFQGKELDSMHYLCDKCTVKLMKSLNIKLK